MEKSVKTINVQATEKKYYDLLENLGFKRNENRLKANDEKHFYQLIKIIREHNLFGWSRTHSEDGKLENGLMLNFLTLFNGDREPWFQRAQDLGILEIEEVKISEESLIMQEINDELDRLILRLDLTET